jgi:cell wall-associated NlpC family hydrolase
VSRAAVLAEARSWIGTPYHPHGRLAGVGVDCANLLCCVYERAGVLGEVQPGFYDVGWHLHRNAEVFLEWMQKVGAREVEEPRPGDCGVWRFGRTYSHGGILSSDDGLVVHAYLGRGVIESRRTEEPLASRPVRWFTLWGE